jgi:predicted P-loop ATPase
MKISTTDRVFSPTSAPVETGDLVQWLKEHATQKPKDQAPLWSPTSFTSGRKEGQAIEVSALVFDFDNGRPALEVLKAVKVGHAWHTSASHTAATPKWRLVIPLDTPIAAKDWEKFWTNAAAVLQVTGHDVACGNVGRFYYVPPVSAVWEVHEGTPFPAQEVLSKYVAPTQGSDMTELRSILLKARNQKYVEAIRCAFASQPAFPDGQRDVGVTGLGFYLGRSVVPVESSCDGVFRLLERGLDLPGNPYRPKEHWETKFKDAFQRGREARAEKTEESKKSQGLNEPWAKDLQTATDLRGNVTVISNCYNASIILSNEGTYNFRKNLLEDTLEVAIAEVEWQAMADSDCTDVANWLQKQYRIALSRQQVYDQIDALAPQFDPLKSFLAGCQWDGVKRINEFLVNLFGCEDTPQARLYSRKWLIGLVARALKPGCKMDTVLVLQGAQGLGKSTALRLLTEPWFSDSKMIIGDKDSMLAGSRFWCHEFAELASLKRADLETMKAFFTSTVDSFRPPYGRATVQKPRRCVYVATTNEDEFLTDPTGARRFWTVKVIHPIDFEAIRRTREQLLAEAVAAFSAGEVWWLDTEAERALQRDSAAEHQIEDNGGQKDAIVKWWAARPFSARPPYLTTSVVLSDIWDVPVERMSRILEMTASRALKDLGFIPARDKNRRVYRPSLEFEKMPQRGANNEVKDFKVEGKGHG